MSKTYKKEVKIEEKLKKSFVKQKQKNKVRKRFKDFIIEKEKDNELV